MLSEEQVKNLLKNTTLSDEKIREIRDGFRNLAEVIFEQWENEKKLKGRVDINVKN